MRTHYDNLQVARNASPGVIKNAYRALVQQWHPDKHPDDTEEASRKLKVINRSYEILSDPVQRKEHDRWIVEQERREEPQQEQKKEPQQEQKKEPRWGSDDQVQPKKKSRRYPLLAGIFSFFFPGLGHLYVGRAGRGLAFVGLYFAIIVALGLLEVSFLSFAATIFILIIGGIYLVVDAVSLAKSVNSLTKESYAPKKYNRWYVYLGYIVLWALLMNIFLLYRGTITGFETYRIPAGSMLPTLYIGDIIVVDTRDVDPVAGDVIVFIYPHDNSTNFIKRVIGLPGDEIAYDQKRLFINGTPVPQEQLKDYQVGTGSQEVDVVEYSEVVGASTHSILNDRRRTARSMTISVPEGSYFVMGDNRDHSNDSRFWGFVPEANIVGKAYTIWFSWNSFDGGINWSRIGKAID